MLRVNLSFVTFLLLIAASHTLLGWRGVMIAAAAWTIGFISGFWQRRA